MGTGIDGESTLRIGLAGCGRIAQLVHLNVLMRLPSTRLVAVAEADLGRRAEASRQVPGAVVTDDWAELVAIPEVERRRRGPSEPPPCPAGLASLAHGSRPYLEKPLATSLEDGLALLRAAQETRVVAMIGFNYRLNENQPAGGASWTPVASDHFVASPNGFHNGRA